MQFDPMNRIYCCEVMQQVLETGSSVVNIDHLDLEVNTKKISESFPQVELKLNQVWIMNDEFGELEGEPFKCCPWCKTDLT